MSVDLSQFHQVFFEESLEGLDVMESALLELDPAHIDSEAINAIFRAAHSIKGGSATFGFSEVSSFTHALETLLDEARSGIRGMPQEDIDLYLQSVDCLREMIGALQQGVDSDKAQAQALTARFEVLLQQSVSGTETEEAASSASEPLPAVDMPNGERHGWAIYFKPGRDILRTGNEPLRMFRELAEHGKLDVEVIDAQLPAFDALEPEACYLAWRLRLYSDIERTAVEEVFEWVVDESELVVEPLTTGSVNAAAVLSPEPENTVLEDQAEIPVASAPVAANAVPTNPVAGSGLEAAELEVDNAAPKNTARKTEQSAESSSIRVGIDKIDSLINMVGELVITQSMLGQLGTEFEHSQLPKLMEGLGQLEQNTRELQESVMRIRMLPISFAFSRFPRMVRDLGRRLDKEIHLQLKGEQTELDKTVMEKIGDPLVHLVRNAIDHGIEIPAERTAAGKEPAGTVTLNAYHQGGNVVIEIADDGRGLNRDKILNKAIENRLITERDAEKLSDEQIYDLIFQPGFSTAKEVSDVSGRGVGMDVVKRNILALKGTVELTSVPGQGSTITIRLPLTLAILDGQLVKVGEETYIFPLVSIIESVQVSADKVKQVSGGSEIFQLRNELVPLIRLYNAFNLEPVTSDIEDSLVVVAESDGEWVGIVVDDLLAQQQVVIKSLEQNYQRVEGVSGATILGDGTVALILDVPGIVNLVKNPSQGSVKSLQEGVAVA